MSARAFQIWRSSRARPWHFTYEPVLRIQGLDSVLIPAGRYTMKPCGAEVSRDSSQDSQQRSALSRAPCCATSKGSACVTAKGQGLANQGYVPKLGIVL